MLRKGCTSFECLAGVHCIYDGLRFLFSHWSIDVTDVTKVPAFDALKRHYESLSTEFGYTVMPPEKVVELFGYELLCIRTKPEEAMTVFKENVTCNPDNETGTKMLNTLRETETWRPWIRRNQMAALFRCPRISLH